MYRYFKNQWLKFFDFLLIDTFALQFTFVISYWIRSGFNNPYENDYYLQVSILLFVIGPCVAFFSDCYKNILQRPHFDEWINVIQQVSMINASLLLFLYLTKQNEPMSRLFFVYFIISSIMVMFLLRTLRKQMLKKKYKKADPKQLYNVLVLTETKNMNENLANVKKEGWKAVGICLADHHHATGEYIKGVPVVASMDTLLEYIKTNVVDGLFIGLPAKKVLPEEIQKTCMEMGIATHTRLMSADSIGGETLVATVGDCTVITRSVKMAPFWQLMIKRIIDIIAGVVGVIVTALCYLIIAPIIYKKDPGPIFFSQTRVGKNGRKFKIYKFRSMYTDAEERKKELMAQNKIADGMMFKMDDDPRIIKGIGHFIRDYSIDELPQFWNVLLGEMSLVGTRPPTVDEYEKYDYHHKFRLSIKPGITGMWQTSGRSNITDFEEVVALDQQYITSWNLALDIKLLFKTIKVVLKKDGAV